MVLRMVTNLSKAQVWLILLALAAVDTVFIVWSSPLIEPSPHPIWRFLQEQMDLSKEANIATWYSSFLLCVTGILAWTAGWSGTAAAKPYARGGWLIAGLVFVLLSVDEVAQVHEQLALLYNSTLHGAIEGRITLGAGDWLQLLWPAVVGAGMGLVILVLLTLRRPLFSLVAGLAGLTCWAGVIVVEGSEAGPGGMSLHNRAERCLEEALEIAGATLLLIALLEFVRSRAGKPGIAQS
jgi:hypothetical protein